MADKSILITGGTTGIGRSTAILLAAQGARVMIFGRHDQELQEAMKDIKAAGGEVLGPRLTPLIRKISNACFRRSTAKWIGSMSADVREKDSSVYVATKAGIQGFSEALRREVNPLGIKVTLIEPGAVGTDMQPQPPEEQRQLQEKMEMLKAEDIATCVLYTISQPKRCDVVSLSLESANPPTFAKYMIE